MTHCKTCRRLLDNPIDPFSLDCGGDCLMCMARAGDPDCARSLRDWADASYHSAFKKHRAEYRAFVIAMPEDDFGEWRGNHYRIFGYHRERAWRDEAKAAKRKAYRNDTEYLLSTEANRKRLYESIAQLPHCTDEYSRLHAEIDRAADNREGWSTAGKTREEVRAYMFDEQYELGEIEAMRASIRATIAKLKK